MPPFPPNAKVMCSGCAAVLLGAEVRVLPWFNETAQDYLTTYRCKTCWPGSLQETRDRFTARAHDPVELRRFFGFFERQGVICLEYRRGDPPAVLLALGSAILDRVASGALVIAP